jgi:hypothetical protein
MEPELAALHASLQQCVLNWPNSMLQDVALDVDNKSALKGDIEEDVARLFQKEVCHEKLHKVACSVCWELVFDVDTDRWDPSNEATMEFLAVLTTEGTWSERASKFEFDAPFGMCSGIPLLDKGMDDEKGTVNVCSSCSHCLRKLELPPRSVANDLWFGNPSEIMRGLTIPAKLLTCPIRQKVTILSIIMTFTCLPLA